MRLRSFDLRAIGVASEPLSLAGFSAPSVGPRSRLRPLYAVLSIRLYAVPCTSSVISLFLFGVLHPGCIRRNSASSTVKEISLEAMQSHSQAKTSVEVLEAVLRAQQQRLAGKYRNRLSSVTHHQGDSMASGACKPAALPEVTAMVSRQIKPLLNRLPPVRDEATLSVAVGVIERALTSRDILAKTFDQQACLSALTGIQIRELMRLNDLTIVQLAARLGVTQKRVRYVRALGVTGNGYCRDWYEAITGTGLFAAK